MKPKHSKWTIGHRLMLAPINKDTPGLRAYMPGIRELTRDGFAKKHDDGSWRLTQDGFDAVLAMFGWTDQYQRDEDDARAGRTRQKHDAAAKADSSD